MIAEYERSQIADRTRRGRLHKARKAEFLPWAYRAYGYRYIPKHAGLPPRVEIHPEQAEVVRDMFRWLIQEQLTTRQIVKRLNALKIPTRTGQNPVWHAASVRCMLSNPIYTGQGYYNRTKSGVPRKETRRTFHPRTDNYAREPRPPEEWVPITAPALLSTETFAKAQEQLKHNQAKARRAEASEKAVIEFPGCRVSKLPRLPSATWQLGNPFCYLSGMEIPAKVSVFNKTLEFKGKPGTLIAINDLGYYEIVMEVQQRNHTVLFPVTETVVIFNEAMPAAASDFEIER